MENATREVFGNISPLMRVGFYALMTAGMVAMIAPLVRRFTLWLRGTPGPIQKNPAVIFRRLFIEAAAQRRVHKKSLGALLHLFLYSGFVVLTIGTTLLAISDNGPLNFHYGWYYLFYELTMDIFGIALCVGCLIALYRRAFAKPPALGHNRVDWLLLALLLGLGITGFLVEGLRLQYTGVTQEIGRWSPVGWVLSIAFEPLGKHGAQNIHLVLWWLHAVMVTALFALLPHSRLTHIITAPLNIALRPSKHAGALVPVDIAQVEVTGSVGVSQITQFSRQRLLSLDACMSCGRCEEACPAFASGKPLSPKGVVLDLRRAMEMPAPKTNGTTETPADATTAANLDNFIADETLWACTMCQACVFECPVFIGHVDLISDLRRHRVAEGRISGPPAKAMRQMGTQFNPYGRPHGERFDWAEGLDPAPPTVESNPSFEYLLWIGCAASFDPRAQKIARATVQLFQQAGLNFAVLGKRECCTGDSARRLGDDFVFQELAQKNIETLTAVKARKIVTPCPHCMNSLAHEYSQFGGNYEVVHHSQLLAQLQREGRLPATSAANTTLHDPCYLARVNGETEAPRQILGTELHEMPRHGKKTFCCGAGGGRMWFEEPPEQRVSHLRAAEALATGANTVATACPFCLNMMTDGIAGTKGGDNTRVLDISEIMINGMPKQKA